MKFIRHILICLLILLMYRPHALPQDSSSTINTRKNDKAIFPGGEPAWENYLRKNIDTAVSVRNKAKKGTYNVVVRFIIDKNGWLSDVKAETSCGYGMEDAVIRAIKKSPRWIPGSDNSKMVTHYCAQSIIFFVYRRKAPASIQISNSGTPF